MWKHLESKVRIEALLIERPGLRAGSWSAFLLAAVLVAAATVARLELSPWLAGVQFITFFPAVIVTTLICGGSAGLFAIFLSVLAVFYFIVPVQFSELSAHRDVYALLLFMLVAAVDVLIITFLRIAVRQVRELNVRLHESEMKFRGFLESAPDALVIVDRQGHIALINAQTERLFGYERAELLGQSVVQLVPARYRESHSADVANFIVQPRTRLMGSERKLYGLRKDGTEIPIEVSLAPVHSNGEVLIASSIRDVTARRQAEAELEEARRTEQIANRAKSEFLSSMSHELRTPLNAVIGFGQMLELNLDKTLTPKHREYVGYILSAGRHLLKLVNEVLDLARVESGNLKLSIERVSVNEAITEICSITLPLANDAGVTFKQSVPADIADIAADRVRLHQVLLNLVSNAIKYNRPGGSVTLVARTVPGDRVRFEVTDTGIGIAQERWPDLFQPFQRLGAEHSEVEGFGIGLALSRRLVEAMDGTIGYFSNQLGEGSTFWVELPTESTRDTRAEGVAAPVPRASLEHKQVCSLLYVEDNPASIHLMEELIATLPAVRLMTAPTPQLGLDLAIAHLPDVILLDLNLPGMNGYEVLTRLQTNPKTTAIPVVALTAAAMPHDIKVGLAAGFFRYITKPYDVAVLLRAIDDALTMAESSRDAAAVKLSG